MILSLVFAEHSQYIAALNSFATLSACVRDTGFCFFFAVEINFTSNFLVVSDSSVSTQFVHLFLVFSTVTFCPDKNEGSFGAIMFHFWNPLFPIINKKDQVIKMRLTEQSVEAAHSQTVTGSIFAVPM